MEAKRTYCSCCVQDLQHALLAIHFHLLHEGKKRRNETEISFHCSLGYWIKYRKGNRAQNFYLPIGVFYCGVIFLHKNSLDKLDRLQETQILNWSQRMFHRKLYLSQCQDLKKKKQQQPLWPKISAPLVNMSKEGCENEFALIILLIFYLQNSQKSNLSMDNNLKWGEISL